MARFVVVVPMGDDDDLRKCSVDEIQYSRGVNKNVTPWFENAFIFDDLRVAVDEAACWNGAIVIPV
jgi:hypothetical protein